MVLKAAELPRGTAVEWVGFSPAAAGEDEEDGEGRWLEMVFADAGSVEEAAGKIALQARVGGNGVLPVATGSVQAFLGAWRRDGQVGMVPMAAVWEAEGKRRGVGCVIRR